MNLCAQQIRLARVALTVMALSGIAILPTSADVRLPALFTDHMVIQRGVPIHIWGWAEPGEKVSVALATDHASGNADKDGKWQFDLKPLPAGGPDTLTVAGNNTLSRRDVLVGDVWLCGGQSNMEFTLKRADNGAETAAASPDPKLRLFKVHTNKADQPAADVSGEWSVAGPDTTPNFSAVGYFFGRDLRRAENVPIGLISDNVGGTTAQAWTRAAVLDADPDLKKLYVDTVASDQAAHDVAMARYEAALAKAKASGAKEPTKPYGFWPSSILYNGMIAPLTPFRIRGVIWYQGESNTHDPAGYRQLLPAMIKDWRAQWNEPRMPFLIVQLAAFGSSSGNGMAWAETREAQQAAAQNLPNVGIAVIIDLGSKHQIHYTDKEPVGDRLALLARKMVYGERNLVASGPTFDDMLVDGSKVIIKFANVGDGLTIKGGLSAGVTVPGDTLVGFAIAGANGQFVTADAKIVAKDTVEAWSPQVAQPRTVRYGFANFPKVNLWNKNGLPAAPFRSDEAGESSATTKL